MTFPLAVVDAVVNAASISPRPFLVGYRISPEEVENPGITIKDTLQLVDALSKKKLEYIHVSVQDFWEGSKRDENDTKSLTQSIAESVGAVIPVVGVGGIHTPLEAERVLASGIPLVAMGRELLMDPNWLAKVNNNNVDQIRTELDLNKQEELKIPDPLWERLTTTEDWIPLKK